MSEKDSILVEYLGVVQETDNILVQKDEDELLFRVLFNIAFGKFPITSSPIPQSQKAILTKLNKNSQAILCYDLANFIIKPKIKIRVYFKGGIDSISAVSYIRRALNKYSFDSLRYISELNAIKEYEGDGGDTSWKSFLENSPLPSSAEFTIVGNDYTREIGENIKDSLLQTGAVSDVAFPDNSVLKFIESYKKKYYLRIRS